MDTFKIKAVLTALEKGSMAKAAEEFSYTPSALSHSIDSLEKELGVKLLERSPKGVKLSEEGKKLEQKLKAVINSEKELFDSAAIVSSGVKKRLRIGAYASISATFLPELLNGFKEKYPEISISITLGNYLSTWLKEDLVDVVLAGEIHDVEWLPVLKDEFMAVVPENMFKDRKSISIDELYPYTYIMNETKVGDAVLDHSKFKEIIPLESEDYNAAIPLIREGMGFAFLPQLVLRKKQKGIKILKIEPSLYRTLGASYKKNSDKHSATMLFVDYLKLKF